MGNKETTDTSQLVRIGGATRTVKRVAMATLATAAFALFAGGIADSFRQTNADTEVQIAASFGNGSLSLQDGACAASPNQPSYDATNNTLNMEGIAGAIISNCLQVTAGTTSPQGYTITIDGPSDGKLALGDVTINNKDGSMSSPTVFASQTNGGVWGFGIPNGQIKGFNWGFDTAYNILPGDNVVNTAKYAPVPVTATPFSYTEGANVTEDVYNIYFGAHIGSYAPTGTYTGIVTISIIGNAAIPPAPEITSINNTISTDYGTTSGPVTVSTDINATCKWNRNTDFTFSTGGTAFTTTGGMSHSTTVTGLAGGSNTIYVRCANTIETSIVSEVRTTSVTISTTPPFAQTDDNMQTITAANCPTTRTRVRDARDGATYWVRKIGNLCWMETNLAYGGGGTNTYGDVIATGTTTTTLNVASVTSIASGNACYYDYDRPCVYTAVPGGNRTTGTTNPSTSTNGTGQYGYLYNWCAAMNGTNSVQYATGACSSSSSTQPNQNINGGTTATQYNVCPANWRLPTGNNNEMLAVANALGWTSGAPTPLLTNGLFMYSGLWNSGAFSYQGSSGYYWSSTISNTTSSYYLGFDTSYVYPAGNYSKRVGYAVRCVAP